MKVALAYDEPLEGDVRSSLPTDAGAEYEDAAAIQALLAAIGACGYEPVPLAFGEDFAARARHVAPDLVFNIAEGVRGPMRESVVPAWLDHLGIPYTGSDGLTLALTLDKAWTKDIVSAMGVRTPRFRRLGRGQGPGQIDLPLPLFVKPNGEGSSMGIRRSSKVETHADLERQVAWTLETYQQDCLVEEFAPGREFCVGILGNSDPHVLPVAEVKAPGEFYSYESKSCHQKEVICPADIPTQTKQQLQQIGLAVYRALRCRDLARVDFKIDSAGQASFLEINPLPGLASTYSIFPVQAGADGITYAGLIGCIIDHALQRRTGKEEMYA